MENSNLSDMTGSVWVSRADLSKKLNVNVDESSVNFNLSKFELTLG